ncbi:non-homologous end-joining DNA ligase [Paraburkholderia tagetis]|uniref:Non-homologous end-joining DNA ligase n=1 Tax=Paraburkholderia tagetis TaxID=2913261 RepID=A0A9X1RW15_9BURK|nr:non-homologous end-joining DNA ligase [Paraburkholderia tagetis]MCG5076069.1 non-homologous end-joining DNA ligase [Paraburkholderia tagetis]
MKRKLAVYESKRRFESTPEPRAQAAPRKARGRGDPGSDPGSDEAASYVIQRHDARRLHYDFRLELDGALKSWAVPKEPSLDPSVKRLAVHVEDHPLAYGNFEGRIPEGNYGAGTVEIWDRGTWRPEGGLRAARKGYAQGKLKFTLDGGRLHGGWALVRSPMDDAKQDRWLLIKQRDDESTRDAAQGTRQRGAEHGEKHDTSASADAPVSRTRHATREKTGDKAGNKAGDKTRKQAGDKTASAASAEVAGTRITHPDRVIDEQSGARKIDLVRYFEAIAPMLLPHLGKRPVSLVRAPKGVAGEQFFQRHAKPPQIPHAVRHDDLDPGHAALLTFESVAALVDAAQMDAIDLHTWNAQATSIEKPDRIVFDLDPDPALEWRRVVEAARMTRDLLDELGLRAWCKTTGGKGLHVVVPLARHALWDETLEFAHAVTDYMAARMPERFSAKMGAPNRKGRIFLDYLRNARGASSIAAYAPRARPGLPVSVPVSWDELDATTSSAQWNIANLHERLDAMEGDPWEGYGRTRQRISEAMRRRLQTT